MCIFFFPLFSKQTTRGVLLKAEHGRRIIMRPMVPPGPPESSWGSRPVNEVEGAGHGFSNLSPKIERNCRKLFNFCYKLNESVTNFVHAGPGWA